LAKFLFVPRRILGDSLKNHSRLKKSNIETHFSLIIQERNSIGSKYSFGVAILVLFGVMVVSVTTLFVYSRFLLKTEKSKINTIANVYRTRYEGIVTKGI